MITLPQLDFYITHHCTLNCVFCNRYNNFNFKGSIDWDKQRLDYYEWSKKLTAKRIGVIGGEPLLHPKLGQMLTDIHKWFKPEQGILLATNGTLLDRFKHLENLFIETNTTISISLHSLRWLKSFIEKIKLFFPDVKLITTKKPGSIESYTFKNDKGLKGEILVFTAFHNMTIIEKDNKFHLHNSDPLKAHKVCDQKKCHLLYNNKIYRCGVAPTIKEFVDQEKENFNIDQHTENLIAQDTGISLEQVDENIYNELMKPIPLCSICPESYNCSVDLTSFFDPKQIKKQMKTVKPNFHYEK